MQDRRESVRDKVMYGGVAEIGERGTTHECIVRNISDKGATIEFGRDFQLPKEQLSLRIARKGRSFLAKVIWWRDNFVGVAFRGKAPRRPSPISRSGCARARSRSASSSGESRSCSANAERPRRSVIQ
ncbi:PilZ domain-containing protein [Bradyrhizobium sp. BWA-3-5]|uniref:PilZ domain-containing protein n=1 Tax=Bradyrhizobium sp. BWA-3-5 TaxID=3080013 RepID=UPI00293F57B5|nr:PilZ domain-containing protein [Bradyrhizobium sp. BWA-3-5]WOH69192.1 PilZ domain-containing protein [Bradyrhizobium sp. BWA-3-5]